MAVWLQRNNSSPRQVIATPALLWSLGLWSLAIAGIDVWRQKIPNLLLVLALVPAVLALAVNQVGLLGAGIGSSLLGLVIAFAVGLPGYVLHKMGAGDVKLAALLGLLGGVGGLWWLLYAGIAIGLMAAVAWGLRRWYGFGGPKIPAAAALVAGFWAWLLWGAPVVM